MWSKRGPLFFFLGCLVLVTLFFQSQTIFKAIEEQLVPKAGDAENLNYLASLIEHASNAMFHGIEEMRTVVAEKLVFDAAQGGIPRQSSKPKTQQTLQSPQLQSESSFSKRDSESSSSDPCNGGGRQVTTNQTMFECRSGKTLTQEEFQKSGLLNCTACNQTTNCTDCCDPTIEPVTSCICSPQRRGDYCEQYEPYACNVTLLSPASACNASSNPKKEDLNEDCWRFSTKGKIKLEYRVHCQFENSSLRFEEFVRNGTIPTKPTSLVAHVYNFCALTDYSLSPTIILSTNQLLGRSNITFSLNFSKITSSSRHVSGGRMYFETRFLKEEDLPGLNNHPVDKHYIDFTDWKHTTSQKGLDAGAIAAIVLGCFFAAFLVSGLVFYLKRKKGSAQ